MFNIRLGIPWRRCCHPVLYGLICVLLITASLIAGSATEASDKKVLSNPKKAIIKKGGFVYFAKVWRSVVGTYAMIKIDAQTYELAKMAVSETFQRQGIGTRLLDHAIEKARTLKLRRLVLYSNTKLAPAINLYFKRGFRVIPSEEYHNERANIKMEMIFSSVK